MTAPSAIIIGAGPAGCSCALLLARAGWQITLLEAATFPRIKVCGEFISPAATALLESLLPAPRLLALGAKRINTFTLEQGNAHRTVPLTQPAWAISRQLLDHTLLTDAAAAGCTIRTQTPVRAVTPTDTHASVQLDTESLTASLVIHADGRGSLDAAGPIASAKNLLGRKCHLRVPPNTLSGVTIRSCTGAYVGSIAVEGDLATIALVASSQLVAKHAGDGDAMLAALWPRYQPAWRCSPWLACPVPRGGPLAGAHPRSLRIGNACAAVDPIGGEGIGLALWSAATLASLLTAHAAPTIHSLGNVQTQLLTAYHHRLRTRSLACRAASEALMRPALVRLLWPALSPRLPILRHWLSLTGKPQPTAASA